MDVVPVGFGEGEVGPSGVGAMIPGVSAEGETVTSMGVIMGSTEVPRVVGASVRSIVDSSISVVVVSRGDSMTQEG